MSPMPAGDLLARELVADDPEGEREDRAADALDRAPATSITDRVTTRGDERAEREHDEHDDEHAVLAEHVAEPPEDRRRDRRGRAGTTVSIQVTAGRRGVQLRLDQRQRGHDEGLGEREGEGRGQ